MKKNFASVLACCLALTAAAPAAFADNTPIKVKYSVTYGATGVQADGAHAFADIIKECSQGRLEMEFYPSSQLGDKASTFEGLMAGTIEMTECAASDLSVFNDIWSVFSLPYLWDSDVQAVKTVSDEAVRKVLESDAENNGFKIIAWTSIGSRSIVNSKHPVKTVDDMEGLKIRCMEDPILAEAINAMGAIGTPMPSSEVYTALQQGTIDACENAVGNMLINRYYEVIKNVTNTKHQFTYILVGVSDRAWQKIPDELKPKVEEAMKIAVDWQRKNLQEINDNAVAELKKLGVQFYDIDREAMKAKVLPEVEKLRAHVPQEWVDAVEEAVASTK